LRIKIAPHINALGPSSSTDKGQPGSIEGQAIRRVVTRFPEAGSVVADIRAMLSAVSRKCCVTNMGLENLLAEHKAACGVKKQKVVS
jgi:hypothetical protein